MLVYNTLTEALPSRAKSGSIGLVLSLEGARYYVFNSRQSRDQVASSNLQKKIALHHELLHGNQPYVHSIGQQKYQLLIPFAMGIAAQTYINPDGRHAEELMIESWDEILHDFNTIRGRNPIKAEVFLSFCPCQVTNSNPSPERILGYSLYPVSCHQKLNRFCSTGNRIQMKWSIYYDHPFKNAPGLNVNSFNLRIMKLPPHIRLGI